jgi:hypothetical protein
MAWFLMSVVTFLFGAGRSEVSINGMNTSRLNYSIKTIQPLSELNTNSKELTFFQVGTNLDLGYMRSELLWSKN